MSTWSVIQSHHQQNELICHAMNINETKKNTNRQWCFRRPSQNSVWQLVHRDTAWSGTHNTLDDIALFVELAPDDGGPLRSSTASHEQIETFSTPLSTVEFYNNFGMINSNAFSKKLLLSGCLNYDHKSQAERNNWLFDSQISSLEFEVFKFN